MTQMTLSNEGVVAIITLHNPPQNRLSPEMLYPLPENLPAERAVIAANMETALNVLWDSAVSAGDRIAIIGTGVLGALIGYLAAQLPGAEVTLIDLNPARADLAAKLGCKFALPKDAQVLDEALGG